MAGAIRDGERDFEKLTSKGKTALRKAGFRPDYLEVCEPDSLRSATVEDQHLVILAAAFMGKTRLIDNLAAESGAAKTDLPCKGSGLPGSLSALPPWLVE